MTALAAGRLKSTVSGAALWFAQGDLFRFQPRRDRVMFGQRPLGPELLVNSTFDTDISGWIPVVTNDAVVQWIAGNAQFPGQANLIPNTGVSRLYQEVTGLTVGAVYEVAAQAVNNGTFQLLAGTTAGGNTLANIAVNTAGHIRKTRFVAPQSNVFVEITRASSGNVGANFVSLKQVAVDYGSELLTNGGFDANLTGWTVATTGDGIADWLATLAGLSGISRLSVTTSGSASVTQELTGLTIGATYEVSVGAANGATTSLRVGTTSGGSDVRALGVIGAGNVSRGQFTATTTNVFVQLFRSTPGAPCADFVSVRQVIQRPHVYEIMTSAEAMANGRLTFSRASSGWAFDNAGNLVEFASNAPRITSAGLTLEPTRTNGVPNSVGVGADPNTNTQPTGWGFVGVNNGITISIVGAGTVNGQEYVDLRHVGTATGSAARSSFAAQNIIAAATGNVFTHSVGMAYIANPGGNLPTSIQVETRYYISGTGSDLTGTIAAVDGTLRRFAHTGTAITAGITHVQPTLRVGLSVGVAYDFTLRLSLPQMELGATATTPIKTNGAAATRAAETFNFNFMNVNMEPAVSFGSEQIFNEITPGTIFAFRIQGGTGERIETGANGGVGGARLNRTVNGGAATRTLAGSQITLGVPDRTIARYIPGGESRGAWDGVLTSPVTDATPLPAVTTVVLGGSGSVGSAMIIRECLITSRLLSDTELQAESLRLTA